MWWLNGQSFVWDCFASRQQRLSRALPVCPLNAPDWRLPLLSHNFYNIFSQSFLHLTHKRHALYSVHNNAVAQNAMKYCNCTRWKWCICREQNIGNVSIRIVYHCIPQSPRTPEPLKCSYSLFVFHGNKSQ